MALRIEKTWVPSAIEWDEAWMECPNSTYFQSREWAEIWADYSYRRLTPSPLGVAFSDGTQIILPLSRELISKGFSQRFVSSPGGTFGGWLAKVPLDKAHQVLLINFIIKQYSNLMMRFNPYEKLLHTLCAVPLIKDETHSLDLSIGFDRIFRNWSKGHSSASRQARKAGVEITEAETIEDWRNYFLVYENSLQRWGESATSNYSWYFFELLFNRRSTNVKLWLAEYEGKVVAGALCFYSTSHVVYWHGAALSSYFSLRPVHLLIYEVIKNAIEKEFKWFDFNPSGELEGVRAFKRGFGAVSVESNQLVLISYKQKMIKFIRTSLACLKKER